jgi:hypothetical protein
MSRLRIVIVLVFGLCFTSACTTSSPRTTSLPSTNLKPNEAPAIDTNNILRQDLHRSVDLLADLAAQSDQLASLVERATLCKVAPSETGDASLIEAQKALNIQIERLHWKISKLRDDLTSHGR